MTQTSIAFIGAGTMAASLIGGLIDDNFPAKSIWASNRNKDKLATLAANYSINITDNNVEAASQADVIVLSVKPKNILPVCQELADLIKEKKPLIISVAAGIRCESIENYFGNKSAIVRCMPNTPSLVRSGITGLYAPARVTQEQRDLAESILRAVGITEWVLHEAQLDAVTAVSGSGPAYFFYIMELLQNEAEQLGLPRKSARLLSIQTALGAARLALESNEDPQTLREQVTSPGGTTAAALSILMEGELKELFSKALKAAKERATELGETFHNGN